MKLKKEVWNALKELPHTNEVSQRISNSGHGLQHHLVARTHLLSMAKICPLLHIRLPRCTQMSFVAQPTPKLCRAKHSGKYSSSLGKLITQTHHI